MYTNIIKNKKLPFWVAVLGLIIFVGYWTYLDMKRELITCPTKQPGTSAFLVLNTLDTGAKKINSTFMVPNFNKAEDTIELLSVTSTQDPDLNNYDSVLRIIPNVTEGTGTNPTTAANRPWTSVSLPYSSQSFFYPFEDYVLNIQIDFKRKSGEEIPLNVAMENRIDETIIIKRCETGYSFDRNTTDSNSFNLILKRHRFVRATAVILYSIAFAFLFYIATREETSKVLTNSLGYIAALWGIRGIIVGSSKLFPTIIDFVTLILYVAVFIIVAYKWLFSSKVSTP